MAGAQAQSEGVKFVLNIGYWREEFKLGRDGKKNRLMINERGASSNERGKNWRSPD